MRPILALWSTLLCLSAYSGVVLSGLSQLSSGNVYVISIGIDDYSQNSYKHRFRACVSDAERLTQLVSKQFYSIPASDGAEHGQAFTYTLSNETATIGVIKDVFREVARKARPEDHLIVFYAGYSFSDSVEGYFVPFFRSSDREADSLIGMHTLSSWMESIAAQNQLVISEAGIGQDFAMDLMSSLFETNPYLAEEGQRNRLLLTTHGYGLEGAECSDWWGGYLLKFISKGTNIFQVFNNPEDYNYDLVNMEMACGSRLAGSGIYCRLFKEEDYRKLLVRTSLGTNLRGPVAKKRTVAEPDLPKARNRALVISTNNYEPSSGWDNLRNPKRDGDDLAQVLRSRYGFEIQRVEDQALDSILITIKEFKRSVGTEDKVLIFIAGHGYYDEDHADGFLAFTDAASLQEDVNYHSYLQMAKLNTMLNHFRCRQLFVVLDVCFGASFEFSAQDLKLSDYGQLHADGGITSFIHHKDTSYTSRIFMASGSAEVMDYWGESQHHSPFAAKLLLALRSEEEFFSPGKLYPYVEGNITEPVLKRFGKHQERADFLIPVTGN